MKTKNSDGFIGRLLIALIVLFVFIKTCTAQGQFSIDSVAFKAFRVDVYDGIDTEEGFFPTRWRAFNTNALFYINGDRIITTELKGQLKAFHILENLGYTENLLATYSGYPLGCVDFGYYQLHINIFYVPETDTYGIRIDYSNMRFLFQCKISDERPWDDDIIDYTADNLKYKNDPNYTDEEVIAFFNQFGNGKAIADMIVSKSIVEITTGF
jgi:hypothetical protein